MPRQPRFLAFMALFATTTWADRAFAAYDPETDEWILGIGDPSVFGWGAAVLYLVAALVLRRRGTTNLSDDDDFSRPAGWAMVFLCLNKALDLQTAPAEWAKQMALEGDWYGGRLVVQLAFIVLGVLFAVWALRSLPRRLGVRWREHRTPALALVALITFILIRASSLHQLGFLVRDFGGLRVGTGIEIVLILVIIAGARVPRMPSLAEVS